MRDKKLLFSVKLVDEDEVAFYDDYTALIPSLFGGWNEHKWDVHRGKVRCSWFVEGSEWEVAVTEAYKSWLAKEIVT